MTPGGATPSRASGSRSRPGPRTARQPQQHRGDVPGLSVRSAPPPARPRTGSYRLRRSPRPLVRRNAGAPGTRRGRAGRRSARRGVPVRRRLSRGCPDLPVRRRTRTPGAESSLPGWNRRLSLPRWFGSRPSKPTIRRPSTGWTWREPWGRKPARAFNTWRTEILSRIGCPDEAAEIYQTLVDSASSAPQVALDAAETLLDNGHHRHARGFLDSACELAKRRESPGSNAWPENTSKTLCRFRT